MVPLHSRPEPSRRCQDCPLLSYLFCVEDAQKVHPLDQAEPRLLRRFRAWAAAAAGEMPLGDDGLTDAAVAAGTASDDRKWVEFVQANLIIRLL